ncbi:MAG: hypothetical protein ACWGPR_11700, partial [Candidatus Deferrimicrobiaceae bacterium]
LSRLIFPGKQTTIPAYAIGDWVGGPGTVVKASASGREVALNIYGDLCVEEVGKMRFLRTIRSGESCGKPGGSRRKSRRTIQEVQKRYH